VGGSDQVPLTVNFFQASQQKAAQASSLFDLSIHRLHDRFALGVDPRAHLASDLPGHQGSGIGISGYRAAFRRWQLAVGQTVGGDVRINALIAAGLGVVLAPVARIQCHHIRQRTGAGGDVDPRN